MPNETTTATRPDSGGFAEDLGRLFSAWGDPDGRECLRGDFAEEEAAEMVRQFHQAERFFEGLAFTAETSLNFAVYMLASDGLDRAREARRVAERYARREG